MHTYRTGNTYDTGVGFREGGREGAGGWGLDRDIGEES
jgi:hypothetical protein